MIITVTLNPAQDKTLEVPNFGIGDHARAEVQSFIPAGKGINVSRGLSILQHANTCCAFVGRRELSHFQETLETEEKITCAFLPVSGRTRTNTTVLDPVKSTTTHLREPGFTVESNDIRKLECCLKKHLNQCVEKCTVVFCGSLPPGISERAYRELLQKCDDLGAEVACDTSGAFLKIAVQSGAVHTIKPNLDEMSAICRENITPKNAACHARDLLGQVDRILLTMGADGAYLFEENVRLGRACRLEKNQIRNTVGCGDAFLAGWLDAAEEGKDSGCCLEQAVATGAACARGATAVDYSKELVDELLNQRVNVVSGCL